MAALSPLPGNARHPGNSKVKIQLMEFDQTDHGATEPWINPGFDHWPSDRIRLVDVGGAGGLQPKWLGHADRIVPVLVEPNRPEAIKLREWLDGRFASSLVVESGLSNLSGPQALNIARYWGCTSLREPNPDVLSKYRIGPLFDIVDTATITCERYDTLWRNGQVPAPDVIKIDVQGFEYEVLQGFGGLLQTCIGIELETHVYPIYKGQKLFGDIINFLADFGFVLRKMTPVPSFDGDVVELDAWFTKDMRTWRTFELSSREKFALVCRVWDLIDYARIDPAAPHTDIRPA